MKNFIRSKDIENGQREKYYCLHPACSTRGLCEFHDKEYAESNADKVMELFNKWIKDEIIALRPIYCIGFYFPIKVNFQGFQFKNGISFSRAVFKAADFSEAQFKAADFSEAQFKSITKFINSDFKGEIDFFATEFPQQGYKLQLLISWNELLEYPNNFDENKIFRLRYAGLYLPLRSKKPKKSRRSTRINIISSRKNELSVLLTLHKWRKKVVLKIIGTNGVYSFSTRKVDGGKINIFRSIIPIIFDYSTFRKRVRFVGGSNRAIQLKSVSFKGVDLSLVEFHNVEWLKKKGPIINRTVIVDEEMLDEYKNYQEVSTIYNQLRKNYESKLLFNEASNFFVGEMEAIRKSLLRDKGIKSKLASIGYSVYKWLALYGESIFLPLIIWTISMNVIFILLRIFTTNNICSLAFEHKLPIHVNCTIMDHIVDSLAAYFQFPRSGAYGLDTLERIISIPILGTAFIAIRRKFERIK